MLGRKYKSYIALKAAFDCGELKRSDWMMIVDNDCTHLVYCGSGRPGIDGEELFEGHGRQDIAEIDAINLRWEYV